MYTNSGFVYVEYKDKLSQFFEYQKVYLRKIKSKLKTFETNTDRFKFFGFKEKQLNK